MIAPQNKTEGYAWGSGIDEVYMGLIIGAFAAMAFLDARMPQIAGEWSVLPAVTFWIMLVLTRKKVFARYVYPRLGYMTPRRDLRLKRKAISIAIALAIAIAPILVIAHLRYGLHFQLIIVSLGVFWGIIYAYIYARSGLRRHLLAAFLLVLAASGFAASPLAASPGAVSLYMFFGAFIMLGCGVYGVRQLLRIPRAQEHAA